MLYISSKGYGGDHCEFEYDECDSSPCINGGACEDLVAGYRCHCGPGYEGRRCQIKVDLCKPNPCPAPAQCVDRGNNYSCICHPGYNGELAVHLISILNSFNHARFISERIMHFTDI